MELVYDSSLKFYISIFENINNTFKSLNDQYKIEIKSDSKLKYPYFKAEDNLIIFKDNLSELLDYLSAEEATSIVLNRIIDSLELILSSKLNLPNFNEQFKEFKRSLKHTVFHGNNLNPFLLDKLYQDNMISLKSKEYKDMKIRITFSYNSSINFRFKDFDDKLNQLETQADVSHRIKNVLNHSLEKQNSNVFRLSSFETFKSLKNSFTSHDNAIRYLRYKTNKLNLKFTRKDIINTLESTTSLQFNDNVEKSKFFDKFSKNQPKGQYTFKDLIIITTIAFFTERYRLNNSNNTSFSNNYFATFLTSYFANKKTNKILKGYKNANSFDDDSPLKSEFNDSILKFKQDISDYLYNKLKILKDGKAYYNYNKNINKHLTSQITYLIYEIFYLNSLPYYEFLMTTFRDYENFISNNLYILNQNNPTGLFDLAIDLIDVFTNWSKGLGKTNSKAFNSIGTLPSNNLPSLNLDLNSETSYSFLKILRLLEKNNFRNDFYNK
ncbi:hypothetical protein [Staphylococcus durrellii]|uniref:hypothetical protein n=1 Tax=Staphylococcus durrellii TaxID=2781773 RepID=UPI00189F135D|nr:hypothetical protein [Staphylococcus durrellii]MBF7018018.1 hypothetical protein [Staphylococcus durrellii]